MLPYRLDPLTRESVLDELIRVGGQIIKVTNAQGPQRTGCASSFDAMCTEALFMEQLHRNGVTRSTRPTRARSAGDLRAAAPSFELAQPLEP